MTVPIIDDLMIVRFGLWGASPIIHVDIQDSYQAFYFALSGRRIYDKVEDVNYICTIPSKMVDELMRIRKQHGL